MAGFFRAVLFSGVALGGVPVMAQEFNDSDDLFLEEVRGAEALDWVKSENQITLDHFKDDLRMPILKDSAEKLLNSPDQLLQIQVVGTDIYNFWRDVAHPRGYLRRSPRELYLEGKPQWEVVLDLDELARLEKENWTYQGLEAFRGRALLRLSRGGQDAAVVREFNLQTKSFVSGGFNIPEEGHHNLSWLSQDEVLLSLGVAPAPLSSSGYPLSVRRWRRGEPYAAGLEIHRAPADYLSAWGFGAADLEDEDAHHIILYTGKSFFEGRYAWLDGATQRFFDLPTDARGSYAEGHFYLELKTHWNFKGQNFRAGSLLRFDFEKLCKGLYEPEILFEPSAKKFLEGHLVHKGKLFFVLSEDVSHHLYEWQGPGRLREIPLPPHSSVFQDINHLKSSTLTLQISGFLTPSSRYMVDSETGALKLIESGPRVYDASPFETTQYFAQSRDGTLVPYYVVAARGLQFTGHNPTLLTAYGGFEVSSRPYYSGFRGLHWIEKGGVYVVANIRGGGEYGPEWHLSAIKENRQRAYDDFFAVSEDLIRRKITRPDRLGILGASNGGLLMGVALTQRPDLFAAVVIEVPLLDMLRYHKLLRGASWVGEYGNPEDPAMAPILRAYSPYHNLSGAAQYPEPLFVTSTADDRVHPAHARRMAARMSKMGKKFYYFENIEGGHGMGANNEQAAFRLALENTYLYQKLMDH